jgi:hypothetical protein
VASLQFSERILRSSGKALKNKAKKIISNIYCSGYDRTYCVPE